MTSLKESNKVLMIAPYFLPRRRVGAYRPFKFAIHLRKFGWNPAIISIKDQGGSLTERERALLKDIPVYELSPPMDRTSRSGSQLGKPDKKGEDGSGKNKKKLFGSLAGAIDRNFPVDTWLPFFFMKKGEIYDIARRINPDLVWATGDPWSGLWAGRKVSEKFGLPYVADFRDPWTLSTIRSSKRPSPVQALDRRAERKILHKADAAVFTAAQTAVLYEEAYPFLKGKTHTVYNSFDRELYRDDVGVDSSAALSGTEDGLLHVTFFGKFRELSPARPVINILRVLKQADKALADRIRIHCFGPLNDEDLAYATEAGLYGNFVIEDPVPPEEALSKLREADLLLLSTSVQREEIVPAKLWDYLAAGRPILSIAPNEEIGHILKATGAGVQFSQDEVPGIASLLGECARAKQEGEKLPINFDFRADEIAHYESRHATGMLADIFNELI